MKTTAYNRIAASLRDRILSGEWRENYRLPPERALCEEFQTSRITIRHALRILKDEGLAEQRQGKGTFVRPNAARKIPLLATDFFGSTETHAPDLTRTVKSWGKALADVDVANTLQIQPGEIIMEGVRVDALESVPVATDHLYLIWPYSNKLTEDHLAEIDFLKRWSRVHCLELTHCTQSIEAVQAEELESALLRVPTGAVLLKETNILFLGGGIPAGLFVSRYRHDYFRFDATVDLRSRTSSGAEL